MSDYTPDEWCKIVAGRNLHHETYEEWSEEFNFDLDNEELPLDIYDDKDRREMWRRGWDLECQQQYEAWLHHGEL